MKLIDILVQYLQGLVLCFVKVESEPTTTTTQGSSKSAKAFWWSFQITEVTCASSDLWPLILCSCQGWSILLVHVHPLSLTRHQIYHWLPATPGCIPVLFRHLSWSKWKLASKWATTTPQIFKLDLQPLINRVQFQILSSSMSWTFQPKPFSFCPGSSFSHSFYWQNPNHPLAALALQRTHINPPARPDACDATFPQAKRSAAPEVTRRSWPPSKPTSVELRRSLWF